jgi:hypothetical protein
MLSQKKRLKQDLENLPRSCPMVINSTPVLIKVQAVSKKIEREQEIKGAAIRGNALRCYPTPDPNTGLSGSRRAIKKRDAVAAWMIT